MQQFPIIINVRDRVEPLKLLVEWLETVGQSNIWFCDNASTYPPLLQYLENTKYKVIRNELNLGHRGPWLSGLVTELGEETAFVVTDPDVIPVETCPRDALDFFHNTLRDFPEVDKVGFSLRIDDIPNHYAHRSDVILWESQFWKDIHPSGFYNAEIDTTFALYRAGEGHQNNRALRSPIPYTAIHYPWYQNSQSPTAEQTYYVEHADSLIINWDKKVLPASLRAHLEILRKASK
jgi:hypothetical protein